MSQAVAGRGQGGPPNVRGRGQGGTSPRTPTRRTSKDFLKGKRRLSEIPTKENKDYMTISDTLEKGSTNKSKPENQTLKIPLLLEVLVTHWELTKNGKKIVLQNYQQKHKDKFAEIDSFGVSTTGGHYYCQQHYVKVAECTIKMLYNILKLDFPPDSVGNCH